MPTIQGRALFTVFFCFMLGSCASVVDALFGSRVDVDTGDTTLPSVQISVASAYVRSLPGNFVVTTEDREAWVYNPFVVAAIGDDPEGVQFVEILEISTEPTCSRVVGRAPGPVYVEAIVVPAITTPGRRNEIPLSSTVATTRMTVTRTLSLGSGWCPADHPHLDGAVARVRARAGNFGGGTTETAIASFTMTAVDIVGPAAAPRGCAEPHRCPVRGVCVPC
jgi:hypothetical protein